MYININKKEETKMRKIFQLESEKGRREREFNNI